MKISTIGQFAINFVLVVIVWFGTTKLQEMGKITDKVDDIASVTAIVLSVLYWLYKYAKQEKWF